MEKLTERQSQVLDWIAGFVRRKGYAPTRQEIGDGLGVTKSTTQQHLDELRRKGRIDWLDGLSRTIRILETT